MNPKSELAGWIMMLVHDEIKPDTQRVLDILCDYRIEHSMGIEDMDFLRQINHFLGAKKSKRTLFFSIRARLMLRHYINERKGGTALFCIQRSPYHRLGQRGLQLAIDKIGQRAGIGRKLHPHVLRHTLATDLLNSGMDITIIQKILGHSSVGTTEIYAAISKDSVRREYEKYVA